MPESVTGSTAGPNPAGLGFDSSLGVPKGDSLAVTGDRDPTDALFRPDPFRSCTSFSLITQVEALMAGQPGVNSWCTAPRTRQRQGCTCARQAQARRLPDLHRDDPHADAHDHQLNGRGMDGLQYGHADNAWTTPGPQHATCNVTGRKPQGRKRGRTKRA